MVWAVGEADWEDNKAGLGDSASEAQVEVLMVVGMAAA